MSGFASQALKLGAALDGRLASWAGRNARSGSIAGLRAREMATPVGVVRLVDSESAKPCVVIVPDGPNVIEHYAALIARLSPELRVVCFDMPGFGFSLPRSDYCHALDQGVSAAVWLSRHKLAMRWYAMALPPTTEREPFRAPAREALRDGAAFSLAGVVQGLAHESQARVENVSVPCTVLWGMQDRTHRETEPESLRACVPNARVVRCQDAGHFPDLEDPARFARLLLSHVASAR